MEAVHRARCSLVEQGAGVLDNIFMKFKHRFEEIDIEFDAMMAKCRLTFDEMTYLGDLVSPEVAIRTVNES
jgi:hypothetical protein